MRGKMSDLVKIDVSKELNEHFAAVIQLRDSLLDSPTTKDSDKVQGINACTTIIKDLTKIQESLYNSELVAKLQLAIVNAFEDQPFDVREKFYKNLEMNLAN
jgi:hypothetical protein